MTRVVMYPAKVEKEENPFISILVAGLTEAGVEVVPYSHLSTLRADALHVHWLEQIFWGRYAKRLPLLQSYLVSSLIRKAARFRKMGKAVVWTVHNLRPHDGLGELQQRLFKRLRRSFLPLVSDIVLMSDAIAGEVSAEYPELCRARRHVIPHPHFRDFFDAYRPFHDARAQYGVPDGALLLASVGMVRPYKDIPGLVKALKEVNQDFVLLVAGKGDEQISAKIISTIGDDPRFIFDNRRLSHKDVASIYAAANAAIFNFSATLNSGSALVSLSLSTPVICPRAGSLISLERDLGARWVKGFDAKLDSSYLAEVLRQLPLEKTDVSPMDGCSPAKVAQAHKAIYTAQLHRL